MSSVSHKLCISLMPNSFVELETWLSQPQCAGSDMIELRADYLSNIDFAGVRELTDKPLIATLRSASEGGFWEGTTAEYLAVLNRACQAGFEYVDVEFPLAEEVLPQLKRSQTGIILSHHTGQRSREALKEIFLKMSKTEAAVYKLVFTAETLRDNLTAVALMELARQSKLRFVIHAMGQMGQLSRLLGAVKGNAWTYVAKDYQAETAAGQISYHEARHFYHLPEKSPQTRLLGLVGSPLQQSKGWRLHNKLFEEKLGSGVRNSGEVADYLYVNFPAEHLDEFWLDWHKHLYGLSVTIPHKEKIIKHLTEISTEVRISGVCNTVVRTQKGWRGHNTDLMAIEELLRPMHEQLKGGGLIVGTGATTRSAIAALKRLEVNPIFVVGRNIERGKFLANLFGIDFLSEDEIHYASASAIIQTTPVGMTPHTDKYPLGTALFRKNRVVLDVIYNPPETRFLKIARDRGSKTISGMEMFLLQAAKQFEIFTGEAVTVEEVRKVWEEVK